MLPLPLILTDASARGWVRSPSRASQKLERVLRVGTMEREAGYGNNYRPFCGHGVLFARIVYRAHDKGSIGWRRDERFPKL